MSSEINYPNEMPINVIEFLCFVWQLFADIATDENALQIQPLGLHIQPFIKNATNAGQGLFKPLNNWQKWTDESGMNKRILRCRVIMM